MKTRFAQARLRPFTVACGLSVTVLACGVISAIPAMAAAVYPRPAIPVLSTSPGGSCSKAAPAVVGNGGVTLQAAVSDSGATGSGLLLRVAFNVYANGDSRDTFASNATMKVDTASGTTADLVLSQTDLQKAASEYGSGGEVSITWTARAAVEASKGPGSPPSPRASCSFTYDTAIPSAPSLWANAGYTTACDALSGLTIGTPVTIYATSPGSTKATVPSSYSYQLNGGNPKTVTAGTAAPYAAAFSVTPTSTSNVLTVTATGPGGTVGQAATCDFTAAEPGPEADQDLTGDNIPDLLTVGNSASSVAPGLWLAAGEGSDATFNGTIDTAATDIAPNGPQNTGTASSWDGYQVIIGQFLGAGSNAVEAYDPSTGVVLLLQGASNGTVNTSQGQNLSSVFDFSPYIDASGDTNASPDEPLRLVDAYDVSGDNVAYPDQIGDFTDPALGSFLAYFVNDDSDVGFDSAIGGAPYILTNATPDGTMDWSNWTITTATAPAGATTASGSPVLAEMYLWNSATGALYLWELTGLANEVPGGFDINTFSYANAAATLSYSQITVDPGTSADAGWNTGSALNTLQATQISGGTGLIDVTATGQVQSWTVDIDDSTATATIAQANAADASQLLQTGG